MTFSRHTPLFLAACLAVGPSCATSGEEHAGAALVPEEALPEVRYYVIADT